MAEITKASYIIFPCKVIFKLLSYSEEITKMCEIKKSNSLRHPQVIKGGGATVDIKLISNSWKVAGRCKTRGAYEL